MVRRAAVCLVLLIATPVDAFAYALTGTVIDVDGQPVAEADIWLSQDRRVRTATTGPDGAFAFEDVEIGPFELVAWKQYYSMGGAEGQIVGDGEVTIQLTAPASMKIRVIDQDYHPIRGARIRSLYVNETFNVNLEDLVSKGFPSARSNDKGVITLEHLPQNSQARIAVGHRNFADKHFPPLPVGSDFDVILSPGVDVRGRILDESKEPVTRARVSFFQPTAAGELREYAEVLSDQEGFYALKLEGGRYYAIARHEGYAMPSPERLQLIPGQDTRVLNITLPPAYEIRGTVIGPEGNPVSGTKISYIAEAFHGAKAIYEETFSGAEGEFALTVASGTGTVRVHPPERMATVAHPNIPFEIQDQRVTTLSPIKLKPLPKAQGTIQLPEGEARDRVLVSALGLDPPRWTVTGEQGRFQIPLEEMPEGGELQLRAEHAFRFLRSEFAIDLTKDGTTSVELESFDPNLAGARDNYPNDMAHMVDDPAPPWECDAWINVPPDRAESGYSLEDLKGKVVVLTLWGGFANSGQVRDRMEELRALDALFQGDDQVFFLAVHEASKEPPEVLEYVREFQIPFPVGCDADPVKTFDAYNTNVIPQTVLIDKEGILRYYDVGGRILELIKDLRRR